MYQQAGLCQINSNINGQQIHVQAGISPDNVRIVLVYFILDIDNRLQNECKIELIYCPIYSDIYSTQSLELNVRSQS